MLSVFMQNIGGLMKQLYTLSTVPHCKHRLKQELLLVTYLERVNITRAIKHGKRHMGNLCHVDKSLCEISIRKRLELTLFLRV